ncbi:hypothetical protein HDK77DRAFT_459385 [Phyllosticta capitalensis]
MTLHNLASPFQVRAASLLLTRSLVLALALERVVSGSWRQTVRPLTISRLFTKDSWLVCSLLSRCQVRCSISRLL